MNFDTFSKEVNECKQAHCLELFTQKRTSFQIKKEKTIAKNLERIFNAALTLSNRKSFHAMSMRDLSKESSLSIGALYNYFSGKEELLEMMQQQRRTITNRFLTSNIQAVASPLEKLRVAIRTHLYLSEVMQPWFYFSYMEAKNLDAKQRQAAVESELKSELLFTEILNSGITKRIWQTTDCQMTASLIKAMLQDWYLKRPKYARRGVDVDQYANYLIHFLERSLLVGETP